MFIIRSQEQSIINQSTVCSHLLHLNAALHFSKCISELKPFCSLCLPETEVSICHPVFRFSCKSINLVELFYCQQQHKQVEGWWWDLSAWLQCVISARGILSVCQGLRTPDWMLRLVTYSMCIWARLCVRQTKYVYLGYFIHVCKCSDSVTVYEVWSDEL